MIYGYARVSTKGQARDGNSLENQTASLIEAGAEKIFCDSFSGKKMERPEFDILKNTLSPGDKLIVTKLDRFARSAADGIRLIENLINKGVVVHVLNIGIMDNTPTGKLIRNIMLSFAEFERDMIVERTQEGKAIAREKGIRVDGRPEKVVPHEEFERLRESQQNGEVTVMQCCRKLGISRSKWYKMIALQSV